jgi:2-oxoglutarate/2-oxoacid ferredoxin oxidoreductase subunit alpha
MIALCPNSPQECFDLMIEAFNISEQYRTPVMFMMDEVVGHMTEKVVIPPADRIAIYPRRLTARTPAEFHLYEPGEDLVPEMAHAGQGYRFHVTGLTHDDRGYPAMNAPAQDKLVRRLQDKIRNAADRLALYEEEATEDADVVVVSYGITSRVSQRAIDTARARGFKVGKFRLKTVWPFPDAHIRRLAASAKAFVVPELNLGQISREVERAAAGAARTIAVTHAGGAVHRPEKIFEAIQEAAQ